MVRGRGWSAGAQGEGGSVESGGSVGTSRAASVESVCWEHFILGWRECRQVGWLLEPSVSQGLRTAHGLGSHEFRNCFPI